MLRVVSLFTGSDAPYEVGSLLWGDQVRQLSMLRVVSLFTGSDAPYEVKADDRLPVTR
ncbi:hypothetical protein [Limnospira platensis]